MKKKVVIAGVVVAVIAVAAGISAMRKKPVEEEALDSGGECREPADGKY